MASAAMASAVVLVVLFCEPGAVAQTRPDTRWHALAALDMRFSALRSDAVGGTAIVLLPGLGVARGDASSLTVALPVGDVVTEQFFCCEPGRGNLALAGRHVLVASDCLVADVELAMILATASEDSGAGDTMRVLASVYAADDAELFLPATHTARSSFAIRRHLAPGWLGVRAVARQRFAADQRRTTLVSLAGTAARELGHGVIVDASVQTTAIVYSTAGQEERFLHVVHLGATYSDGRYRLGGGLYIPVDASQRQIATMSVAIRGAMRF